MSRKSENQSFICLNCKKKVLPLNNGSYRNHCPHCLYSLHVDISPGDRQSECLGLMASISLKAHSKKGYQILHKCLKCGTIRLNIIAENTVQSDDIDKIKKLPFS